MTHVGCTGSTLRGEQFQKAAPWPCCRIQQDSHRLIRQWIGTECIALCYQTPSNPQAAFWILKLFGIGMMTPLGWLPCPANHMARSSFREAKLCPSVSCRSGPLFLILFVSEMPFRLYLFVTYLHISTMCPVTLPFLFFWPILTPIRSIRFFDARSRRQFACSECRTARLVWKFVIIFVALSWIIYI